MSATELLLHFPRSRAAGEFLGIVSICSANDFVLSAALTWARDADLPLLIEATANQVNQFGGYIGMTPAQFKGHVAILAGQNGYPAEHIILGGDHLGPLTWVSETEEVAMGKAVALVEAYAQAGYNKIHLDTSMRLGSDDPNVPLTDEIIARRGAILCKAAERAATFEGGQGPVYVIGSEVPIPGGAHSNNETVQVTSPEACRNTLLAYKKVFFEEGLQEAWKRVVGLVVQPGVEFSDSEVLEYNRGKAAPLCEVLREYPIVFEGHSTDYQTPESLRRMVEDGICILKVGPALTFALRECLFALEMIERELLQGQGIWLSDFSAIIETVMLEDDSQWRAHYHGRPDKLRLSRKYSYSDRQRYYLGHPKIRDSIQRLIDNMKNTEIPLSVLKQYLPLEYEYIKENHLRISPEFLIDQHIRICLQDYQYAVSGGD